MAFGGMISATLSFTRLKFIRPVTASAMRCLELIRDGICDTPPRHRSGRVAYNKLKLSLRKESFCEFLSSPKFNEPKISSIELKSSS